MSELEKKFYEYLINRHATVRNFLYKRVAHDLAEIAAQHYVNCDKCLELCAENTKLKKQIEIMKDIIKTLEHDVKFWKDKSRGLAIPVTKEKIIKVLESPLGENYKAENNITLLKKLREQIANEILGEDK